MRGNVSKAKPEYGDVTTEKIADRAVTMDKLAVEVNEKIAAVASVDTVGGIKLYSGVSGGKKVNRSGLIVDESTGVTYVATQANGGISRNGAGALHIVAATDAEVEAGTDTYKPITPATLKKVRESLFTNIDSLNNKFEYSTTPQRIGTWINGKPIYRTVSQGIFDAADIDDISTLAGEDGRGINFGVGKNREILISVKTIFHLYLDHKSSVDDFIGVAAGQSGDVKVLGITSERLASKLTAGTSGYTTIIEYVEKE